MNRGIENLSINGFKKDAITASKAPTGIVKSIPNTPNFQIGFKKGQNCL